MKKKNIPHLYSSRECKFKPYQDTFTPTRMARIKKKKKKMISVGEKVETL